MKITGIFIRRPVATTLIMLGLLFFGGMGYTGLPVNNLPGVDFPTIMVSANLSGADPETMAASVATPLERQFSTVSGIDSMSSTSSQGRTRIVLQFALDRNIDAAAQDVQSAIAIAQRKLPSAMTTPPSYRKVNPADFPILYLGLSSATMPMYELDEYAETMIAQRLSMISGVAQVSVYGAKKYAVRVQLDPRALASRSVGIDEVAMAIDNANVNSPTGSLDGDMRTRNIKSTGQLLDAAAFRPITVAYRNGAPVRLEELGNVLDSVEADKQANWINGELGITLAVERQPGANTIAVVDSIRKILPEFEARLPAAVKLEVVMDRSQSIRASVHDVQFTLILTIFLVIGVIFLFLRNLRATIIPSLALPLSVIATFGVMFALGYSLDNLSLMALTLALGFVVDDAIVMLENCIRHMEMGKTPLQAACDGAAEIGFTIISMTISLAAVFIPVLFMGGIVGRLFQEFSMVIVVAILFSGFVSLSLTPMLCAYYLKPVSLVPQHGVYGVLERGFMLLFHVYEYSLQRVMHHRLPVLLASFVLVGLTGWMGMSMPKGFLPADDASFLSLSTEADQTISYQGMYQAQKALHPLLEAHPAVDVYSSMIGSGGTGSSNTGRVMLQLKPMEQRGHINDVMADLRRVLNTLPNLNVFVVNPPSINIGGRVAKSLYQYTLQGPDTKELYAAARKVEQIMRGLPEIQDVTSDLQMKNPEVIVEINRDKAASLGISPAQIELALQSAYGAREVSTIYAPTNDYSVIMELKPEFRDAPAALSLLYVRSQKGELVPLDTLTQMRPSIGPMSVNHSGQFPAVTLAYNTRVGVSISQALAAIEKAVTPVLPNGVTAASQGTAQAFQDSMRGMGLLLFMAIMVIYIVLGVLYESFIHPLTILSGLPAAGFGALSTLWFFGIDLNLYALVGIIMLIGIVKKNAIMMLDFAIEAERRDKLEPEDAIVQGCLIRFRPIMMTTMAALMGALPIAIGFGAGAEARRPLGLAVVGGLCVSQVLTLYLTPVYYVYLDKLGRWLKRETAALM